VEKKLSQPTAKIICDSISPEGVRLVTMEVKLHRGWAQYRHEFENENVKEFIPNYKERLG
jgi:hypothetical protein